MGKKESQVYVLCKKRRLGIERRQFLYSYCIPERRSFRDRRGIGRREISRDITSRIKYKEALAV
jgi:hypothetical protein